MSEVIGDKEMIDALRRMGRATELKFLRSGVNAALTPPLQAARANAPRGTVPHQTYRGRTVVPGFLARSPKKRTRIKRDRSGVIGWLFVQPEAWYGSLIQHGWRPGRRSRAIKQASRRVRGGLSSAQLSDLGDTRGKVPGRDWFTGPVNAAVTVSFQRFQNKIKDRIAKVWRR